MNSLESSLKYSLAGVLAFILIGLLVLTNVSTRHVLQDFVVSRLEHDAINMLDAVVFENEKIKFRPLRINPIYHAPFSGHYFSLKLLRDNQSEVIASLSLQGETLPEPDSIKSSIQHDVLGPKGQRLIMWTDLYQKQGKDIVISVAEDMSLLKERRGRFRWVFVGIGFLGILLMLLMQRFIIRRLFLNLDNIRYEVKQIVSGKQEQLSENVSIEIYPLVKEFNHSLSLMQQRLERSRNSLGNLAHALKTPLSVLVQTLDKTEKTPKGKDTQLIQEANKQVERISQLTERELKRARMAGIGNTTQRFNPREELTVLCDVLKQAHQKPELEISLNIANDVNLFGDREDMLELLGNLLDNAFKWARSRVSCSILRENIGTIGYNNILIYIEDDGEGQTKKTIGILTKRGVRIDESVVGHGLGLSICTDIVKLYGGTMNFGYSEQLKGFKVTVIIPSQL